MEMIEIWNRPKEVGARVNRDGREHRRRKMKERETKRKKEN
jgi:hypothetical protein